LKKETKDPGLLNALPPEVGEEFLKLQQHVGMEIGQLFAEVIRLGITAYKKKAALEEYGAGKITLSAAADLCGATIYEMIDEVRRLGLPMTVYTEDLRATVFESARSRAEYYRMLEEWGKE